MYDKKNFDQVNNLEQLSAEKKEKINAYLINS